MNKKCLLYYIFLGGTLKIYGDSVKPDVPYKTLLLSTGDTVAHVVRETLEKYGLEKDDAGSYCLVQVRQGCPIYGEKKFLRIFITCFSLRTKKRYMDKSTDVFLLGSATTPTPDPISLSRLAVFRACRVNFFVYYPPGPVRLPKSQDFSEF